MALGVRHGGQCVFRSEESSDDDGRDSQSYVKGNFQFSCWLNLFLIPRKVRVLKCIFFFLPGSTKPRVCSDQCRPGTSGSQPVCGSDGQTYANLCQLEMESCKNPAKGLYMVTDAPCRAGEWFEASVRLLYL